MSDQKEVGLDASDEEEIYLAEHHVGFEARLHGEPFDESRTDAWQEGWQEADAGAEVPVTEQ